MRLSNYHVERAGRDHSEDARDKKTLRDPPEARRFSVRRVGNVRDIIPIELGRRAYLPKSTTGSGRDIGIKVDWLSRINFHGGPRLQEYSEMSTMATHERKAAHSVQHSPPALTDMFGTLVFGFSWSLVMAIGLAPLAEASLSRSPSITMPTTIAFFVALGSAILLRRRYSWMGLVLHIFGQIASWLSLFVMSLAIVLVAIPRGWSRTALIADHAASITRAHHLTKLSAAPYISVSALR
jgi:hypothetical protein